ncbi:MAG: flagellar M-ring protein FliF C-terminal domain-containing protein, partial [Myxococcota bacterium]
GSMDLERTLAKRVERMLEAVVGPGNVAVTVTAELDRELVERTEELYDQSPEKTALRSETREVRGDGGVPNVGGPAGARGNLPGTGGAGGGAGAPPGTQHLAETKQYEVNRIVRKSIGPKQRIKRLHLAVLVDEAVDEEGNPIARTPEALTQINAIAREAAGLDAERGDKIEVHSVPFVREEAPAEAEAVDEVAAAPEGIPTLYLAAGGAAAAVLFVVFFLILRRRRKKTAEEEVATTLPMTVGELQAELPEGEAEEDGPDPATLVEELPEDASPLERASAVAASDTELAARILRGWLAEAPAAATPANDEVYDEAA